MTRLEHLLWEVAQENAEGDERMMFGKHKFKVGQRVRPSPYGIKSLIFPKTRHMQTGKVVKVDKWNSPTIIWAGFKMPQRYFAGFIEPDRRRNPPPTHQGNQT